MIGIEFPKLDINDIKVLITEKVSVSIDIWLDLNVEQGFENVGFLELPVSQLIITLSVCHVKHSVDHTQGIPVLKLWTVLQELQTRMDFQNLLEQDLKILNKAEFLSLVTTYQPKCPVLNIFVLQLFPHLLELSLLERF